VTELSTQERFRRGAADAGRYFRFMADFVGYTPADADAIRATRAAVEKHLPRIIGEFYEQLLSFPATRKHFVRKDGSIDEEYLELRMRHQANFWRRVAAGQFDEDFARFLDYVGRAHTSHGADPRVYIPERYVTGMIGFVQRRITEAIHAEIGVREPLAAARGVAAWNTLLMVVLELLARPYGEGREEETYQPAEDIEEAPVHRLAEEASEDVLRPEPPIGYRDVLVGPVAEIPDGERKMLEVDGTSIGVFRYAGAWYALQNSCLHRGGPVCSGNLVDSVLTCPWHGYEYNITTGELLLDTTTRLPMYPVEVRGDDVFIRVPVHRPEPDIDLSGVLAIGAMAAIAAGAAAAPTSPVTVQLRPNEFRVAGFKPNSSRRVEVDGIGVAVFNLDGAFYAIADECSHAGAPLSEGDIEGTQVVCPWHASCFDICTGAVLCGPADEPQRAYRVVVDGEIGRVEQAI
jgi:nitrite reductase/ring-hydroxylating ferredoxin subunit